MVRVADETPSQPWVFEPAWELGARLPSLSNLNSCLGEGRQENCPGDSFQPGTRQTIDPAAQGQAP